MSALIDTAVERVREAIRLHKPSHVFALYSGGHDSRCAVEIACRLKEFSGCVHCNTGIGVEETREHVRETCKEKGFRLLEYKASENTYADGSPDPQNYDDLVHRYGFPGPGAHWRMYVRLKARSLDRVMREHKRHSRDRILFVTGVRSAESVRRMGTVVPLERRGCQVWCNPIHDWETYHKERTIRDEGIRPNPVVEAIGMSGECLCGAFAKPGELDRVSTYFPYVEDRLQRLHNSIKDRFPCAWDDEVCKKSRALKQSSRGQQELFMPMCWNCNKNQTLLPAATA